MIDGTLTLNLLLAALACFGAGAAGALLTAGRPGLSRVVGHTLALLGSGFALALGAAGLMGGTLRVAIPEVLPVGGGLALGMDRLSAFFILVIAVGAVPASLYALGYTRAYEGRASLAGLGLAFNAFLASMVLVALARNVLTFLALWEAMSLASYFLVMTESEREDTQRAGWVYLVMTHAGFACLLMGLLLMTRATGTMDFADWGALSGMLKGTERNAIFVLLALGFGSKAGVIPLHVWLPRAHPAAPSHVSALMSGVMIKLGVYGLVRAGFDWLGVGPAWWGGAVLVVAALSAVLGVLYALVDNDLKRLLAYSSVENIGIILLGVGAGMLFQSYALPALAALALVAALYHTLNHAAFKSLLFMGAGAVLHATHTRNLEEMGGLIKRMPQTAVFFLVGSVAIAALPPFNGFLSEWLTFQALLLSFRISAPAVNLIFGLGVAALALTGGLAAACFVKAFGISFLALPRSEPARNAHEVGWTLRAAMAVLAVACLLLGVAPSIVLGPLSATALDLTHAAPEMRFAWDGVGVKEAFATASPLCLAVALVALLGAVPLALRLLGANARRRTYETWGCGRALQTARFEYTGTAFAHPFKRVFDLLYRPVARLDIEAHPESRFFVRTITYRHETRSVFEDALYRPLIRFTQRLAQWARIVQSGNVHSYLLYILIALVVLLVVAR
ncbi:MAG: hydrogenase 4 subunit B [Candidatus Latescibacteria bacterium]|nr:hydrogenase 4 subunit B [Candidatus Latescibacterota bacterium]